MSKDTTSVPAISPTVLTTVLATVSTVLTTVVSTTGSTTVAASPTDVTKEAGASTAVTVASWIVLTRVAGISKT